MKMSQEEARNYIMEELVPMVELSSLENYSSLCEDFEALEIAFASGNNSLIFAMAEYIASLDGLLNGTAVKQKIIYKVLDKS